MPAPDLDVLLLTPDYPPAHGGIQRLLHGLLGAAGRLRARVVTFESDGAGEFDRRHTHPVVRVSPTRFTPTSMARLNVAGMRAARAARPDVIVSGHIVTSPSAVVLRRALGVPTVQYLYGMEIPARPRLTRFATAGSDATIALSRYTRDLALAAGAPRDRLSVIPPGVEEPPTPDRANRAQRPTIVTVARLGERYKGHDVMVRALGLIRARVPDVQWHVVGDGPLRRELGAMAEAYGVRDLVRLDGAVSDAARDQALERAHVFAMPSRLPAGRLAGEGFGIAYLEAGSHGLPVVAGDVGGALDAVEHGVTGFLVDPTSPVAVADAVAGLLLDPERAEQMGAAGRRRAEQFAWPVIARRVEDLLFEVVARARAR
jgi:phosphatidylinositol alpha-1,6-mannosyltransferase